MKMMRRYVMAALLAAGLTLADSVLAQVQPTQPVPAAATAPKAAAGTTSKTDAKANKAAQKAARQAKKAQQKAAKQASKAAKQAAKVRRQKDKATLAAQLPPKRQKAIKHVATRTAPTFASPAANAPASNSSGGGGN